VPQVVAVESTSCFDEQTVLDLIAGRLSEGALAHVDRHLGSCELCTDLVGVTAPLLSGQRVTATLQFGGSPDDLPAGANPARAQPAEDHEDDTPNRRRPSLAPGTVLRETYQIVRRIGQGGMGDVYEAKHARLTGRYAVKVLPPEFALNVAVLSRFRREAQIASGLQHPNIVQVIDFHETDDGTPYLVMEYLDGEDLAAAMARRGAILLGDAMPLIEQMGDALSAVHKRGIVHRDVKPQNVFLIPREHGRTLIKLVDFGLSKANAPSLIVTRQPMLLGTPQYMAPEQALARVDEVGPATDQFALAAIVYQMLSGRPPFVGERISSVLYQIVHEDPPPLGEAHDPRVEAVLRRGLAKKVGNRFPSLAEFVDALRATLVPVAAASGSAVTGAGSGHAAATSDPATAPARPDSRAAAGRARDGAISEQPTVSKDAGADGPRPPRRGRRLAAVASVAFLATLLTLMMVRPSRGPRAPAASRAELATDPGAGKSSVSAPSPAGTVPAPPAPAAAESPVAPPAIAPGRDPGVSGAVKVVSRARARAHVRPPGAATTAPPETTPTTPQPPAVPRLVEDL
jgi:hypothetical protein